MKKTSDEKELMYLKYRVQELLGDDRPIHVLMQDHNLLDYPRDLNAMHEAENTLTWDEGHVFNEHLYAHMPQDQHLYHATARQRAEAFIAVKEQNP